MDFLILRPLSPKTGYHFFEGWGGWGVVGWGSTVFAQKAPSSGEAYLSRIKPRGNGNAADCRVIDCWFESWSDDCRTRRRRHLRPTRVQTADQKVCGRLHYHSATACPENSSPPHCLEPGLPLTKNPNCVFLSD